MPDPTPHTRSTDPIGPLLRQLRESAGLTLGAVEEQIRRPVEGRRRRLPWERGDRHVTFDKGRELLAWYGGRTIEILAPGDVVVRAGDPTAPGSVEYVVQFDDWTRGTGPREIIAPSIEVAKTIAENMPRSRAGYRASIVTDIVYLDGES